MKFKVGDRLLAYKYDSIGYYRGDDLGNAVEIVILDVDEKNGKVLYLTSDKNKNWEVYTEKELFKNQEEIDEIKSS